MTNGYVVSQLITTNPVSGNRSITFVLNTNGAVEVTPFAPDVVRVRFHFAGLYDREQVAIAKPFSNWPGFASVFTNVNPTNFVIETAQLRVEIVTSNRFQIHFKDKSGYFLLQDVFMEFDPDYHQIDDTNAYAQVAWPSGSASVSNLPSGFKLRASKVMPGNEAYFGLGEFGGPLNRRGQVIQGWNQDTFAFEEFRNPMYMTLPFFHGVRSATTGNPAFAYGLFFNNPARPVFRFNGTNGVYTFEAGDDQLDYFFFGGGSNHTMKAVIDRFSELTGRPTLLPRWALGYHQSRHSYTNQDIVQNIADDLRAQDFPCDAIYLDIDTQAQTNNQRMQMTFSPGFTNVPGMVSYCTNLGIRLVPIIEPCIGTNDPLYAEPLVNNHFLKQNDFQTYVGSNFLGPISWIDFSSAPAAEFWRREVTNFLSQYGLEAIWNDLNEPNENDMPLNVQYFLGNRYGAATNNGDTRNWHAINKNTYNVLQCAVSYDALRSIQPAQRPLVLSRSAWPGIQQYAVGWSGDNISSFDNMRFNIRLGVSVMISGQAHFGHDIGGFVGDAPAELLTRWLEWGVLNPLCRNHTLNDTSPQEPWVYGEPYTSWNRRWIKFRYELMPYLYSLAYESNTNGIPINTPTVFHFTSDTNTWSQNEYDFMVGDAMLATPVYLSNTTVRSVYLPAGAAWYFRQYDLRFEGGQTVQVPVSLGTLPLWLRAGAILPMGPAMAYANQFQPDYLDVHYWPGGPSEFTLHEDDGLTTNHLGGHYARTRFTALTTNGSLSFTIHPRTGSYNPGARSYYLIAHAVSNVVAVSANGNSLTRYANRGELESSAVSGWSYGTANRQLTVKIPDTGAQVDIVATMNSETITNGVFPSSYTNMAVAGTFTHWDEAGRNMRLVSNNCWAAVLNLAGWTNIEFKFVANDNWLSANWGDNDPTNTIAPLSGMAESSGANIMATGAFAGAYTFTFHETNLTYSMRPAAAMDSDGDGMDDAWELYFGLNPMSAGDATTDLDGDGVVNRDEYIAGTSVVDVDAYFVVLSETLTNNNGIVIAWEAVTGRTYEVSYTTNLLGHATWLPLAPHTNVTGSGVVSVTDTNAAQDRSYRVGVRKLP